MKDTQSQIKIRQYVEDLRRNKFFVSKIKRLRKLISLPEHEEEARREEILAEGIFEEYIDIERKLLDRLSTVNHEFNHIIEEISEKYALDFEAISTLFLYDLTNREELIKSHYFDLCTITDNYDQDLNDEFEPIPIFLDTSRKSHIRAYPISIDIHRFATKRDVLDFINKRWDVIADSLKEYNVKEKGVRFRKRKYDLQVVDYIWENRNKPNKVVASLVNSKFPEDSQLYTYVEIQKILSAEKIRRERRIRK